MRRIVLAAAVVSLLLAAFLMLQHRDERAARDKRQTARLPSFDDRRVTGVVLETRTATWRLVRTPTGWRVVAPVDDVADRRTIESLIGAAERAPILQTIAAPDALSTYGLAPPVARLTLDGVAAPTLELGSLAPAGDAVFARLAGSPAVLLLGLPGAEPLAGVDPASLRDRSIVDLVRSELVGLEIASGGPRLSRDADGWWITAPRRFPASPAALDKLLGSLYGAKVVGWDDLGAPSEAKYGFGATAPSITLRAASEAQTITLGAPAGEGKRFVASEGRRTILIAGAVPPLDAIPLDLARLRETRLTNVNRYDVTRLVYTAGGARFAATRKDESTWITETGNAIRAERVYTLLVALLEAETVAWTDGPLKSPPAATLSYGTDKDGAAGGLEFAGESATWDALPGVVFRLASTFPPVPADAP